MSVSLRRRLPPGLLVERWTAPDGWPLRRFRQDTEDTAAGSLLFLGGRGDFFEKYLEAIADWRAAGWNVAGFDWRGQGGSGRLHSGGGCHLDDFALPIDDLAAFCRAWRAETPGPHVAVGHSLGGHLLLKAIAQGRVDLDGMILLAPMLGIRAGPLGNRALGGVATLGRLPGLRRRAIWSGPRSPAPGRVTSCPERQADKAWWKAACPELGRGGPTWGWLAAATRSIAELERLLRARPPVPPGLLLAAAGDPIVDSAAIRRVRRFLPDVEHAEIAGAGHELLRERDGPRTACLAHIRRFLASAAAQS
jgi:lysophospholipase